MVVPNHHHRHGASDEWRRFYRKVMTSHHLPQSVPKWPQPRQLSSTRLLPIENADGQALPDFAALPPARPQEPAASNHHHSRQPALYRHKDRETSDQNHTGFVLPRQRYHAPARRHAPDRLHQKQHPNAIASVLPAAPPASDKKRQACLQGLFAAPAYQNNRQA